MDFKVARIGFTILVVGTAMTAQAEPVTDAWIGTRVKAAMLAAEGVDGMAIDVDALDGVVILHGEVPGDAERTRAGAIAVEVDGVRGVRNLLAIVAPSDRDRVNAADELVALDVEHALAADPELAGSRIEVESVHAGIVLLGGRADSLASHRRALADVRDVAGVLRVESEIRSTDAPGDRALWEKNGVDGTEPRSAFSRFVTDGWITARAKLRLLRETGLSPLAIDVDTEDGVVTVSGIVESAAQKNDAEAELMQIDGVVRVANYLQVVPLLAADTSGGVTLSIGFAASDPLTLGSRPGASSGSASSRCGAMGSSRA